MFILNLYTNIVVVLTHFLFCARTIYILGKAYATSSNSPKCFRRLFAEFDELKSSLPSDKQCSAWLRFDEETPQYLRALLTAPLPGPSPYAGGVFAFDIFIPDDYPMVSPRVKIVTTGQGTVRFGPNLYADGKVCLSLLGTWEGPKWDPKQSSLYQVLVSIQSLILGVEHPYYLEPSYGKDFRIALRKLSFAYLLVAVF